MAVRPDNPFKLAVINKHRLDENIKFEENSHTYTIDGDSSYTSVTTFVHNQFEKFDADKIITNMMRSSRWEKNKYYGKSREEIKEEWLKNGTTASTTGTRLHFDIECFYNGVPNENNSIEYNHFLNFNEDHKYLEAFRTEWMIYDKPSKLAGSVDMIFKDGDDLHIYDWKRCKEIVKCNPFGKSSINPLIEELPDTNYWHYCLQLNIYKYIIEKNYGYKVKDLYLIVLHPKNKNYQKMKVIDLQRHVNELVCERTLNI